MVLLWATVPLDRVAPGCYSHYEVIDSLFVSNGFSQTKMFVRSIHFLLGFPVTPPEVSFGLLGFFFLFVNC